MYFYYSLAIKPAHIVAFRARYKNIPLNFGDLVDMSGSSGYVIRKNIISVIDILKEGSSV